MNDCALVVIGYNRKDAILRLLNSLNNANYYGDAVPLIISLDFCGDDSVLKAVNDFKWKHGEKRIRTFTKRQGLREHVLSCGDFLNEFDAIAVLEDDLVVSPSFYSYMKSSVAFYKDNDDIAGVSLYTHHINVNCFLPFYPLKSNSDVFFMKFAMSWGEIWMKKQWFTFKQWYDKNKDTDADMKCISSVVGDWPHTSWLKYHIRYCAENNKYFVYPYHSLTTCFNDKGTHALESADLYNVPLSGVGIDSWHFCELAKGIRYDAFFENENVADSLDMSDVLTVDLYGLKSQYDSLYVLTRKDLPYHKLKTFGLNMRPHENNILFDVPGDDIYLYALDKAEETNKKTSAAFVHKTIEYYYNISYGTKRVLQYILYRLRLRVEKFFRRER